MTGPLRILFVCTANIARSPYLELRAKSLIPAEVASFSSAGTHNYPDQPMYAALQAELAARGVVAADHRSRPADLATLSQADLILTATAGHRSDLLAQYPQLARTLFTLSQFIESAQAAKAALTDLSDDPVGSAFRNRTRPRAEGDLSDPYGRGAEAAAACATKADELLDGLAGILARTDRAPEGQPNPTGESTVTDQHEILHRWGVRVPDVLLPRPQIDLSRWAVVACDQFTSQPDYWHKAAERVGDEPSTLNLIFPEAYLEQPDPQSRIAAINKAMVDYLTQGLFDSHAGTAVLVRREIATGVVRWGLIVALDLEQYSWELDARSLIRATEGTILDRLPPRVQIREGAALELPHIMVLIDDPARSVIEPLAARATELRSLYDTELMLNGGRVAGWAVDSVADLNAFAAAIDTLGRGLDPDNPLLFAMGDGNHSFATAKSIWENIKGSVPADEFNDHPARYCLVELENLHDPGLEFEPIHRVLFGATRSQFEAALAEHCGGFELTERDGLAPVMDGITDQSLQRLGFCDANGYGIYTLTDPDASLGLGTLQHAVDDLVEGSSVTVDYIHGSDITEELGRKTGNLGLLLPPVSKHTFFGSIKADGALPRKTFSMGEAQGKRYYLEARSLR